MERVVRCEGTGEEGPAEERAARRDEVAAEPFVVLTRSVVHQSHNAKAAVARSTPRVIANPEAWSRSGYADLLTRLLELRLQAQVFSREVSRSADRVASVRSTRKSKTLEVNLRWNLSTL